MAQILVNYLQYCIHNGIPKRLFCVAGLVDALREAHVCREKALRILRGARRRHQPQHLAEVAVRRLEVAAPLVALGARLK